MINSRDFAFTFVPIVQWMPSTLGAAQIRARDLARDRDIAFGTFTWIRYLFLEPFFFFFFFFACGEILMDTPLLLIIGNSRVVSDSYRLKLHDDHPTRMTGVLQEPLMNYVSVASPSRVLFFEPVLTIPWLLNLALGGPLPLALSPLLVVVRCGGDKAALGRLTAIPLHCVILQGWEFLFFSLSARSFASITRWQKRRTALYSCGPLSIASTIAEGVSLSPMTCRRV